MHAVEDVAPGVGAAPACRALGLARASLYRMRRTPAPDLEACPAPRPSPPRALSPDEREAVLGILHGERFMDHAPAQVHARLLDEGSYLCSTRTMYRILDSAQEVKERRNQVRRPHYAEGAVFVHMGGTMTKSQELDTIKSGRIQYKDAQIQEVSVRFVGTTAILLNRIRLVAVVGGNEVVNPFNVTEVYVKLDGAWKLASLSFTRLMTP